MFEEVPAHAIDRRCLCARLLRRFAQAHPSVPIKDGQHVFQRCIMRLRLPIAVKRRARVLQPLTQSLQLLACVQRRVAR